MGRTFIEVSAFYPICQPDDCFSYYLLRICSVPPFFL